MSCWHHGVMIRGVGLYRDGEPVPGLADAIGLEAPFDAEDVETLERMWSEAKTGSVDSFVWLGLRNASEEEVRLAAGLFGIDELRFEGALTLAERPHVEIEKHQVFAVFNVLGYIEETSDVETGQISVFVGPSFVLSIRQGSPGDLHNLRSELESNPQLLRCGPMAVFHGIADLVVDGYQYVADEIAIDIEQVEERVFSPTITDDAPMIYKLKRENLEVRRAVDPLRTLADQLLSNSFLRVAEPLVPYFHDLGDHLLRVSELSAQFDTLLGTALEESRSRQAMQQNSDTRKISAWAAIFAVPTAIAGIYGMNFDYIPELHWRFGYPLAVGLMLTACVSMYRAFKRSGWL